MRSDEQVKTQDFSPKGDVMHYKAEPSVRDIMMSSPITLQKDNRLSLAEEVMTGGRVRHVPILDGERLVGVLSQADLFHSAFAKALHLRPAEQREFVNSIKIEDAMSKHVFSVPADTSIRAAARLMTEKKLGCLPVVQGERLVGLVTKSDMLRYLAERKDEEIAIVVDIVC
jgi:CBS domain-containing membrane protein